MPPDPKSKPSLWPFGFCRCSERDLLQRLLKMMEKTMATAADINAKVDALSAKFTALGASVAAIRADIQVIKDNLPSTGGMTQAEVDALDTRLGEVATAADTVVADAAELDSENPAPTA